jgi:hypothetical protein
MSEVKVNKISPRTACGTVTLGDSGDTFTIPSGATINNQGTAVNFGATGSASWVTTVKTSSPFTAVAGEGYFVNTTSGPITVNLPAGTAGAVVAIKDYANTFDTNVCTLVQNGSDKIGGSTVNATLNIEGLAVTLVFIDSTQGWLVTDSGLQSESPTASYVTATGGTITTSGDYRIHTFTGPGALCVSNAGNASGSTEIEYIVVGGGGSMPGINYNNTPAGGGGAGGFRFASPSLAPLTYPAKPLAAPAAITASVASFPIVIGAGGTGGAAGPPAGQAGTDGSPASFSTITSAGGGPGGYASTPGSNGGSGGGQGDHPGGFGAGNTPPVSPSQGNPGGMSVTNPSNPAPGNGSTGTGGGGGAIEAGANAGANPTNPTSGGGKGGDGAGVPNAFGTSGQNCGSNYYFAGGGGGGVYIPNPAPAPGGPGGLGGGGAGGVGPPGPSRQGTAGTANTGGGGGAPGASCSPTTQDNGGKNGGSGIVVIRYKFQN